MSIGDREVELFSDHELQFSNFHEIPQNSLPLKKRRIVLTQKLDSPTGDSVLPPESDGSNSSESSRLPLPEASGYSPEASDNYHLFTLTSEFDIEKLLNGELEEFNSKSDDKGIQTKEADTLVRESPQNK
jgi:hypothetical protein